MASSYKIRRSRENKVLYFLVSAFLLYRYVNLLNDFDLNKTTDLLLLSISSLALFLFFAIVYMNRIFFLNNCIVLIFAPKLLVVKYDDVEILESKLIQRENKYSCFVEDENQIHIKVKNKVHSISTNNNENVIKLLRRNQSENSPLPYESD